jgi:hypothetical protein
MQEEIMAYTVEELIGKVSQMREKGKELAEKLHDEAV